MSSHLMRSPQVTVRFNSKKDKKKKLVYYCIYIKACTCTVDKHRNDSEIWLCDKVMGVKGVNLVFKKEKKSYWHCTSRYFTKKKNSKIESTKANFYFFHFINFCLFSQSSLQNSPLKLLKTVYFSGKKI